MSDADYTDAMLLCAYWQPSTPCRFALSSYDKLCFGIEKFPCFSRTMFIRICYFHIYFSLLVISEKHSLQFIIVI